MCLSINKRMKFIQRNRFASRFITCIPILFYVNEKKNIEIKINFSKVEENGFDVNRKRKEE